MEEILASIRRIISEDNRPVPGPAPAAASDAVEPPVDTLGEPAATATGSPQTSPSELEIVSPEASASVQDGDPPLDLTLALPPSPDRSPVSPLLSNDYPPVLDLTNEVRDTGSPRPTSTPDRPGFLGNRDAYREEEREYRLQSRPLPTEPIEEPAGKSEASTIAAEPGSSEASFLAAEPERSTAPSPAVGSGLLSASTEAATVSALSRLRQAAAKPQGPTAEQIAEAVRAQVALLLDERFEPALGEALPAALAERLPAAIREQVGPQLRERTDPLLRDEIVGALDRRLDPLLREQAAPLLSDRTDTVLREEVVASVDRRVEPLLNERFGPALNERLEPLLRERLDPLLREWLDRNLSAIVERVVEREIERLVRQPGGN